MHEQYRPKPDQHQPSREGGADYSAILSSIRADQNRGTFVADLRENKEQLLSLAQNLMRKRGSTPDEDSAYLSVGGYLDIVLKRFVFSIDPFVSSKHPDNEQLYDDKLAVGHDFLKQAGFHWYDEHPRSQAARQVALHGLFASHWAHRRLLQEMWPSIRVVALHSQKKK